MMDYQVAIPSYKREETLKGKTLQLLKDYKVDPERVHIFVADEQEHDKYLRALKDEPFKNVHVAAPGIKEVRNAIRSHFDTGTKVFHLDDDVTKILYKVDDKKLAPIENVEKDLVQRGFDACEEHGANIWGVYAASNPYFMRKDVSVGLYFIVGTCYGNIIRHDEDLYLTISEKEDYERSLQYYLKDGAVVRLDSITIKSAFYTEPGGLQHGDRGAREEIGAKALVEKYPDLCSMYYRKTTGFAEIRLRDSRPKPTEVPDNNIESFF